MSRYIIGHRRGVAISYGKLVIAIPMVLGYRPGHEDASSTQVLYVRQGI